MYMEAKSKKDKTLIPTILHKILLPILPEFQANQAFYRKQIKTTSFNYLLETSMTSKIDMKGVILGRKFNSHSLILEPFISR